VSLELLAALRRGEVVGVQGDRALGTRGDVEVPFFGHPARFPLGPFRLSSAVKVPLLPAFCLLDSQYRYVVKISEAFIAVRGEEEAAARTWVAALEDIVREYHTQWFHFRHLGPVRRVGPVSSGDGVENDDKVLESEGSWWNGSGSAEPSAGPTTTVLPKDLEGSLGLDSLDSSSCRSASRSASGS
jgi:hypothetical protein